MAQFYSLCLLAIHVSLPTLVDSHCPTIVIRNSQRYLFQSRILQQQPQTRPHYYIHASSPKSLKSPKNTTVDKQHRRGTTGYLEGYVYYLFRDQLFYRIQPQNPDERGDNTVSLSQKRRTLKKSGKGHWPLYSTDDESRLNKRIVVGYDVDQIRPEGRYV